MSDPILPEALLKLSEEATPGPWNINTTDEDGECVRKGISHIATCDWQYEDLVQIRPIDKANAALIVAAVNWVRDLAARQGAGAEGGARGKADEALIARAKIVAQPDPDITYPSRSAANRIRELVRDLGQRPQALLTDGLFA